VRTAITLNGGHWLVNHAAEALQHDRPGLAFVAVECSACDAGNGLAVDHLLAVEHIALERVADVLEIVALLPLRRHRELHVAVVVLNE
jgi:hypothetical protein